MNHKLIKISLLLITLSILIPIVFLSFFNYPAADDFSYGVNPQGLGFIEKNIDRYFNWTSRYFATSVLISSPIVFGSTSYFWIYPLLFIALFYFSIFRLLKSIGIDSFSNNLLTLSLMSVYTLVIPSLTENFYWLAGSVTYFLPSIALLVLIASTLNILNHKKTSTLYFYFYQFSSLEEVLKYWLDLLQCICLGLIYIISSFIKRYTTPYFWLWFS